MLEELDIQTIIYFSAVTFLTVMLPGQAAIGVCAQSINCGYKSSLYFILGIAIANVLYFVFSATGLTALLLTVESVFIMLKYAGIGYLLYMGIMSIFSSSASIKINPGNIDCQSPTNVFKKGFIVEMLNPKALLFFFAVVPQFVVTSSNMYTQFLIYCFLTFFFDIFCYSIYALFSKKIIHKKTNPQVIQFLNVSIGVFLIIIALSILKINL